MGTLDKERPNNNDVDIDALLAHYKGESYFFDEKKEREKKEREKAKRKDAKKKTKKKTKKENKTDYLGRDVYVNKIVELIKLFSEFEENVSFAINGEWGIGKTFLLRMVEEQLREYQSEETNNDRFAVFHYNCWQYDYYEEPLVAIVSMMINQIEENEKLLTTEQKKKTLAILKGVGTVALSCFNKTIESKTGVDINALLENIRAIEEGTAETLESIRDFDPFW